MYRAALLTALAATGCGFSVSGSGPPGDNAGDDGVDGDARIPDGPDEPGLDGPTSDGPLPDMAVDMMPDAMLTWVTLETRQVLCAGTEITSTTVLGNGTEYRLRAIGECVANPGRGPDLMTDAEHYGYDADVLWTDMNNGEDIGLAVNHQAGSFAKQPRWGAYTATHEYQVMFTGLGATIRIAFVGGDLTDNSGMLTFEIQHFQ